MRHFAKSVALVCLSFALSACNGDGSKGSGGGAGIGGSGYTANGSVTDFGSIFVNGVEFDTSGASFEIEGSSGSQADLQIGMRVIVEGSANSGGTAGTAVRVRFEDQLEGPIPVGTTITEDADAENKSFTVLGVPVTINAVDTNFVGTNFSYTTIAPGDNVQISGFFDAGGLLHATAVILKNAFVPNVTIVEAKGTITSFMTGSLTLRVGATTLTVDTTTANLSGVPGGVAVGQQVEAKGTLAAATATTIVATEVKIDDDGLNDGLQIELEGILTRFSSAGSFDVDGQPVNASSAVLTPSNLTLRLGLKVEVEGPMVGGVLQATAVKLREGTVRVHATASSVNTAAGTFVLTIAGQTVTVTANTSTELEDKTSAANLTLATLSSVNGRFLKVRGYDDGTGRGLIATRIRIDNTDDVILQGVVESQVVGTSVTVLGVAIPVDGTTDFQDVNNATLGGGHTQFAASVTNGVSLIRVKDKAAGSGGANPVGVADEIELQTP